MLRQPLHMMVSVAGLGVVGASCPAAVGVEPLITIELASSDHIGHLSISNVKNWGSEQAVLNESGLPDYPYFFDQSIQMGQGGFSSLVAEPLSGGVTYPEALLTEVFNTGIWDEDFATRSSGTVTINLSGVSGNRVEVVPASSVQFAIDGASFSPISSIHNAGSGVGNAGWDYVVTVSNPVGPGMTLVDGEVVSIDLVAEISVLPRLLGSPAGAFANAYDGVLRLSGRRFAFDVDVTQDNQTILDPLTGTRLVYNRAGTIDEVDESACSVSDIAGNEAGFADGMLGPDDIVAFLASVVAADRAAADVRFPRGDPDFLDLLWYLRGFDEGCE